MKLPWRRRSASTGNLLSGFQIGLRGRITLAVALVGLLLSVVLSVTTITVARSTLLDTREDSLSRQAVANSETVRANAGIDSPEATDLQTLLSSLPQGGIPSLIVGGAGPGEPVTVSVNPKYGVDVLPSELRTRVVEDRENSIMRFHSNGQPLLAVGVAVPDSDASYFEVNTLDDIDTAIRSLSLTLLVATALATIVAMALGFWASRYALHPLRRIGEAAESVALGQLDTRIDYDDYASDIDLAPLVANFNEMVSALQERIDRDARFASDVSHELRSPLTTLNASIEVLLNSRDELSERSGQALDLLNLDMRRFTQLVEDLLEISRFDAGAVRLELDTVALVPTVEAAVRIISDGDVPVEADPELADVAISCDKRRLMRILANFLDNASKYADGATAVFVERSDGHHDAHHDNRPDAPLGQGPMIEIAVEDSGSGVPEAERTRIFDRFNRGDQGGARGTDLGVGLGLALAAEHARLQGGRVWVEDRHDGGQGSRFVLELPLNEPTDDDDDSLRLDDLAAVTPEEAESFALTGELPAIRTDGLGDRP
ncbi:MAG: HAMP domain-containing histidine kinase [Actinomycetota bacterium]|nr:HAMP domain-containing histidine kinase [Actinomycetota bacterium]